MTLFKYLPPARADFFKTLRLRYSQPAAFNDPFEGKPFYPGLVPDEWMFQSYPSRFSKVLREQYDSMGEPFQNQVNFAAFSQLMEYARPEIYELFHQVDKSLVPAVNAMMNDTFTEKMGALALSEVKDNLLMWGHYAESHKGFVIEFDADHPLFAPNNADREDLWQLHRISYAKKRPQTFVVDLDMKAILLTKHDSWSYEREWKHFRPLPQANATIPGSPLPICLFDFPPDSIKSVIFGALASDDMKAEIKAAIGFRQDLAHVMTFKMQLDKRQYKLHALPC